MLDLAVCSGSRRPLWQQGLLSLHTAGCEVQWCAPQLGNRCGQVFQLAKLVWLLQAKPKRGADRYMMRCQGLLRQAEEVVRSCIA